MIVIVGYAVSFWGLSQVVKTMPLGIMQFGQVWDRVGFRRCNLYLQPKLDLPAIIGMLLIIIGVLVINLFSKSSGH